MAVMISFLFAGGRIAGTSIEPAQNVRDDRLILGFARNLFADVNIPDALAAMKIWATEIKKRRGFEEPAETRAYEDVDALRRAVREKQVDLVIVNALNFLEVRQQLQLEPHFVVQRGGKVTDKILLLVHRSSGIADLDDLEQKDLMILDDARSNIGTLWLETLLFEKGYPNLRSFFGDVEITEKASRAVLPLFFRKTGACLVHRAAFEMMAELNPQLQRDLKVLDSSPDTIPSVSCIRKGYNPILKEALIDAMLSLHQEPRGQQILMLFREDQLVPFKESYLDSIKQLLSKHRALAKNLEKD
jgi:phosphonate transport system substrate-binding protein